MKIFLKAYLASLLAGVTFFFMLFLLLLLVPKEEKIAVRKDSILHLSLDRAIIERDANSPFGGINWMTFQDESPIGLNTLVKAIKNAKTDDKIQGIFIDFGALTAGTSTLKELRNTLIDFKESGKFVWSYADVYAQSHYYLASASDSVFFNPSGYFDWHGLASTQPYLKDMFDKIGVKPVVVRGSNNRFKSAVEPFLGTEMSDENREQITALLGDVWAEIKADVAKSRNLSTDNLQMIADSMMAFQPKAALKLGLVDALIFRSDLYEKMRVKTSATTLKTMPLITASRYVQSISDKDESDKIAVIYAEGDIGMGEGGNGEIGPETVVNAIRKATEDEDIKAIVLRVNSPGGSALGSDIIHNELLKAKAKKPLVISMGDLAASGGYFISAPGDAIVAQPTTITGSIGVFMLYFTAENLLEDKLGLHFHTVKTAAMADLGVPNRDLTDAEYRLFQRSVDQTYGDFISRVTAGRGLDSLFVDSIGQGRVWTGVRAQKLGLVDELGGLDRALEIAAEKAKIKTYSITELPVQEDPIMKLLNSFSGQEVKNQVLQQEMGPFYESYKNVQLLIKNQGMQARMPYNINFK